MKRHMVALGIIGGIVVLLLLLHIGGSQLMPLIQKMHGGG